MPFLTSPLLFSFKNFFKPSGCSCSSTKKNKGHGKHYCKYHGKHHGKYHGKHKSNRKMKGGYKYAASAGGKTRKHKKTIKTRKHKKTNNNKYFPPIHHIANRHKYDKHMSKKHIFGHNLPSSSNLFASAFNKGTPLVLRE